MPALPPPERTGTARSGAFALPCPLAEEQNPATAGSAVLRNLALPARHYSALLLARLGSELVEYRVVGVDAPHVVDGHSR